MFINYGHTINTATYRWEGESVNFNGNNVVIGFGNHLYPVSWTISKISLSGSGSITPLTVTSYPSISKVNFTHYSYNRVFNSYQNSAVLTEWGNGVRVAQIYSFLNNGIDASIAIENMNNVSGTFAGTFVLEAHAHKHASLFGYNPMLLKEPLHTNTNGYIINSNQWKICQGNISINWLKEISIFHAGTLISNKFGSAVSLPFGPIQLSPRETYSIDPVIRPMSIIGGGGGGSTGAQVTFSESGLPTGTSWSVTLNGHSITSTSSDIYFEEVTGESYPYTIGTIAGYTSSPTSGTVSVGNGGAIVDVKFTPNAKTYYNVNFDETGIPSGVGWCVDLNGQVKSSNSSSISFSELSGTYSYTIPKATGIQGQYSPSLSSGTVNVAGNTVINTVFTQINQVYSVTFKESGLPSNTYWSVLFNNSAANSTLSGKSMNFSAYDGTYSYTTYCNPESNGVIYHAYSGIVKVSGSSTVVTMKYSLSVSRFSVNGTNGQQYPTTYPDYYIAQQGFTFSLSYTNATSGDGIYFYAITSGGAKIHLFNNSSKSGCPNIQPVGSGTSTWTWDDQPGYYIGFEAVMAYNGNSTVPNQKTISISMSKKAYIYDIFPCAIPNETNQTYFFSDTQGLGKVYNSSTGDVIANLSQVGSMGIDGFNYLSNMPTTYGYMFTTGIKIGNGTDKSYGVWNETQTFSYVNNTLGQNSPVVQEQKISDCVQGDSSNNYTANNAYTGAQELWYATAFALGIAALVPDPPYDIALGAAHLIMDGVGQFIFATLNTSSKENPTVYNTISDTINGTMETDPTTGCGNFPPGYSYIPIENASGGMSVIFAFKDSIGFNLIGKNPALNYFTYTVNMNLINVGFDPVTGGCAYRIAPGNRNTLPPMYSTSISIPMYLAYAP
jgi:hypothetical protein